MPTRAGSEHGVGASAKLVADHASTIARLELELAALELKRKVAALGIGIGMALGGAVLALFGLGFAFATVAEALSIVLDRWLALLIVTAGLFGLAGLLALLGLAAIKRGTPPVPEQAIEEAKLTTEALRSNGSH
jgi:putative superfamily III holin-X